MNSHQNPAYFAETVLNSFWNKVIPVDPIAIAKCFGINVVYDNLPGDASGALVKTKDMDYPIILVDQSDPDVRKRFTIAHEIGHYIYNTFILELKNYEKIDYRNSKSSGGTDTEEIFANKFAAALLMPESYLKKLDLSNRSIVIEQSAILRVSAEALNYRLDSLKGY
ncbi:ImmA/IrrE family metallo-endopeptidase [Gallibacterium salpingitidis]|uniref:ImmA/IrrE family metallo-endopeptidase n=1 Tax=Gallibacterium salpingitidis TaxID=505341 RepID=UPI000A9A0B0D|nr:ImmA/IrrE family metallo-endopeptidase [Gallibacterium salpingitidis]